MNYSTWPRQSRRLGVSPLFATIFLIGITVVIVAILLNWSTLMTSEQTQDITNKSGEISTCAVLSINDVYLDFASNVSRVFVKSSVEGTIADAKLLARNGVDMPLKTKLPLDINKGEIKIVEFNLTSNLSSCTNFSKVVVSKKCASINYDLKPTNC